MKTILFTLCACAGTASASGLFQSVTQSAQHQLDNSGFTNPIAASATGDTVGAGVTGFGAGGGAFLSGAGIHTIGGSDILASGAPGTIPDGTITSSVSTVGGVRTLTIVFGADGGGAIAPAGLAIGGAPVDTVFFELPGTNGGTDLIDDPMKIGVATGTFDLLGTAGASLFSSAATITDSGTSFSANNGVGITGVDLFDPAVIGDIITGGSYTISYAVIPAPSTFALLGLGGVVAHRRRR